MRNRYWINKNSEGWKEVTKETFVKEERRAGFRNTMGEPLEPATASFSCSKRGCEVQGTIYNPFER